MSEQKMNFEKEEVKLNYLNIMLEITRRCNLKCEHCMRGEAQNLDLSGEVMERLFSQVDSIFQLSLTGGEPFIAPDVIENMVDIIIKNKVKVWQCTTVENGTILDERGIRCIRALNRLGEYIMNYVWVTTDIEEVKKIPISVSISNSNYHQNDIEKAIEFYKQYAADYVEIQDQGDWNSGLTDKNGNNLKMKDTKNSKRWIRREGRADENNIQGANYITDTYAVEFHIQDDKVAVKTGIQICANGNVAFALPLSFDTFDSKNMGNILTDYLSCMIFKWNWKEPLSKAEIDRYCNNLDIIRNPKVPEDKKAERELQNLYLDMKKTFYVEGHNDYPYLDKKDLSIAVTCMLAYRFLEIIREHDRQADNVTDAEIIKTIMEFELEGEFTEQWGKQDLKDTLDGLIEKNNVAMIEDRGFLGYFANKLALAFKTYADMYELKNCYDK